MHVNHQPITGRSYLPLIQCYWTMNVSITTNDIGLLDDRLKRLHSKFSEFHRTEERSRSTVWVSRKLVGRLSFECHATVERHINSQKLPTDNWWTLVALLISDIFYFSNSAEPLKRSAWQSGQTLVARLRSNVKRLLSVNINISASWKHYWTVTLPFRSSDDAMKISRKCSSTSFKHQHFRRCAYGKFQFEVESVFGTHVTLCNIFLF